MPTEALILGGGATSFSRSSFAIFWWSVPVHIHIHANKNEARVSIRTINAMMDDGADLDGPCSIPQSLSCPSRRRHLLDEPTSASAHASVNYRCCALRTHDKYTYSCENTTNTMRQLTISLHLPYRKGTSGVPFRSEVLRATFGALAFWPMTTLLSQSTLDIF